MSGVLVDGQEAADHTQMCWQHQYDVLPQVGWAERMVVVVTHTHTINNKRLVLPSLAQYALQCGYQTLPIIILGTYQQVMRCRSCLSV